MGIRRRRPPLTRTGARSRASHRCRGHRCRGLGHHGHPSGGPLGRRGRRCRGGWWASAPGQRCGAAGWRPPRASSATPGRGAGRRLRRRRRLRLLNRWGAPQPPHPLPRTALHRRRASQWRRCETATCRTPCRPSGSRRSSRQHSRPRSRPRRPPRVRPQTWPARPSARNTWRPWMASGRPQLLLPWLRRRPPRPLRRHRCHAAHQRRRHRRRRRRQYQRHTCRKAGRARA